MNVTSWTPVATALALLAMTTLPPSAAAQQAAAPTASTTVETPARTARVARGTFTVQMKPLSESGFGSGNANVGRSSLDKVFEGDLKGTGTGEMLSAMTQTRGSAGYVAIERVTGTLHGRQGSFVLQHTGIMDRGSPSLTVTVVPDSGAGDLVGLQGQLKIRIEGGKHFYDFDYSLPELVK